MVRYARALFLAALVIAATATEGPKGQKAQLVCKSPLAGFYKACVLKEGTTVTHSFTFRDSAVSVGDACNPLRGAATSRGADATRGESSRGKVALSLCDDGSVSGEVLYPTAGGVKLTLSPAAHPGVSTGANSFPVIVTYAKTGGHMKGQGKPREAGPTAMKAKIPKHDSSNAKVVKVVTRDPKIPAKFINGKPVSGLEHPELALSKITHHADLKPVPLKRAAETKEAPKEKLPMKPKEAASPVHKKPSVDAGRALLQSECCTSSELCGDGNYCATDCGCWSDSYCEYYQDAIEGSCPGGSACCESHDECGDGNYCATDCGCWSDSYCDYYQDSVTGTCPGASATPTSTGCNGECCAHEDCGDGYYCDTYMNCYGLSSCAYWDDAIDGVCPETTPSPDSSCYAHDDCDDGYYCDTYNNCYALSSCAYWDDAIDGVCPEFSPSPFSCDSSGGCCAHEDCDMSLYYCDAYQSCYDIYACSTWDDAIDGECPPEPAAPPPVCGVDVCCSHDDCLAQYDAVYCSNSGACYSDTYCPYYTGDSMYAPIDGACPADTSPPEPCGASNCCEHADCNDGYYCDVYNACWASDSCAYYDDAIDGECPEVELECEAHEDCDMSLYYCDVYNSCYDIDACPTYDDAIDGECPDPAGGSPPEGECSKHTDCEDGFYCDAANECWDLEMCAQYDDAIDGTCPEPTPTPSPVFVCEGHSDCEDGYYCDVAGDCWDEVYCAAYNDAIDGDCPSTPSPSPMMAEDSDSDSDAYNVTIVSASMEMDVSIDEWDDNMEDSFCESIAAESDVDAEMVTVTSVTAAGRKHRRNLLSDSISVDYEIEMPDAETAELVMEALQVAMSNGTLLATLQEAGIPVTEMEMSEILVEIITILPSLPPLPERDDDEDDEDDEDFPVVAVAAGAAGGVAGLFMLGILLYCLVCKKGAQTQAAPQVIVIQQPAGVVPTGVPVAVELPKTEG